MSESRFPAGVIRQPKFPVVNARGCRFVGKVRTRCVRAAVARTVYVSKQGDPMTTSKVAAFFASIALALAAPALAHDRDGGGACSGIRGQMETLCAGAPKGTCLSTLCPDVPPGPGQWPQCLLNLNAGTETKKLTTPL